MYFDERRFSRPTGAPDDRKVDLPAVHVARKRQGDPVRNPREKVRLVNEQDRGGLVVDFTHRRWKIVGAATVAWVRHRRQKVAQADQPERPSALGQSHRLIFQQRNTRLRKRPADAARIIGGSVGMAAHHQS